MGMIVNTLVIGAIPLSWSWSWFLTFDVVIILASILLYSTCLAVFQI